MSTLSLSHFFFFFNLSSIPSLLCFTCVSNIYKPMSLRPFSALSISAMEKNGLGISFPCSAGSPSSSSILGCAFPNKFLYLSTQKPRSSKFMASVSKETDVVPLKGVIFQPFEEVKNEAFVVPVNPQLSLARQYYADECEAAINEQINVEYNVSYVYHAMFAYFDRDNIALKGLAKFFKTSSEEEREHAEKFIKYQNIRGGKVKLHSLVMPHSEFERADKGDALFAMELALSLEKLTNEKLLKLHSVAERNSDPQLADFVESEFLAEQVEAIKKIAEFVTQLRMVGKGHGVWHFDQKLLHEDDA